MLVPIFARRGDTLQLKAKLDTRIQPCLQAVSIFAPEPPVPTPSNSATGSRNRPRPTDSYISELKTRPFLRPANLGVPNAQIGKFSTLMAQIYLAYSADRKGRVFTKCRSGTGAAGSKAERVFRRQEFGDSTECCCGAIRQLYEDAVFPPDEGKRASFSRVTLAWSS